MQASERLALEGLRVAAGARILLDDVHLLLPAGRMVALVGASGSGKTLTARAMAGLIDARPGVVAGKLEVVLQERRVLPYADLRRPGAVEAAFAGLRGGVITWMPQEAAASLDPVWTVGAQIDAVLRAAHPQQTRPDPDARHAALAVAGFARPADVAALYPHALSGGMAQRVAIGLALARQTRFLLADEPTTGLDPTAALRVLRTLSALRDRGVGVLLITHDLRLVPRWCDEVVIMHGGRVVEALAAADLARATAPEARSLLAATARVAGGVL